MTTKAGNTHDTQPATEPLALRLSAGLGPLPTYLGDGVSAFPCATVASWPAHNRERMTVSLYDQATLDAAVAAERERCADEIDKLNEHITQLVVSLVSVSSAARAALRPNVMVSGGTPSAAPGVGALVDKRED